MQFSPFKSCSSILYIAFLLKSQQTRVRYLIDIFMVIVMVFFSLEIGILLSHFYKAEKKKELTGYFPFQNLKKIDRLIGWCFTPYR